ncbi:MAG: hypothetical protein ACI9MJ_001920 [Alphaproteobacteria bacterium]|jgi:hypothetical protein
MKLRHADREKDYEEIINGIREFVRTHVAQDLIPADAAFLPVIARRFLDRDDVDVMLAEGEGGVLGGVAFFYLPYPWNPTLLMAEETAFWCRKEAPPMTALALLRFAEKTARMRGADLLIMHSLSFFSDRFGTILQRLGYEPFQSTYVRRL